MRGSIKVIKSKLSHKDDADNYMFKETLVRLLNVNKSTIHFNKLNIANSVEKVKTKMQNT